MGGVDTEVTEATTRVLLESAWFEPRSIRRTTRQLKLNTDASARFGRDIDPNGASVAAARIAELVREIDPGVRLTSFADQFPRPRLPRTVTMKFSEIERLLGMSVSLDRVLEILERLNLQPRAEDHGGELVVITSVPTYRNDINIAADLVEEVIRIHGYEHIPETLITGTAVPVSRNPARLVDQIAQNALVEAGLFQVQTYTMINEDDLRALSPDNDEIPDVLGGYPRPEERFVRAANPLRSDWVIMRPTMLPSLLRITGENLKYNERVAVFETARTYQPEGLDRLPDERRAVTIVLSGTREEFGLHAPAQEGFDFFDAKGVVEHLLRRLGGERAAFTRVEHPSLHPGRAAAVELDGVQIGVVGELHPSVSQRFGIAARSAVAEIDLEPFAEHLHDPWNVQPVGRYQPVLQDFAVVVAEDVPAARVEQAIRSGAGPLAAAVVLFDIYRGENIEAGRKSLAYRVTFAAPDRQPAEHEIERARDRIARAVAREVGGFLRT
jgi:phenylalanyl-tRNA synthetase beta chain